MKTCEDINKFVPTVLACFCMNTFAKVSTITLLFQVTSGYMFRLKLSHPQAYVNNCVTRYSAHFGIPSCTASGNRIVNIGLRMAKF